MKRTNACALAVGLVLGSGAAQAHWLLNAGFEIGNLSEYDVSLSGGTASVTTFASTSYLSPATYFPASGSYFLSITSGDANVWQEVKQALALAAGETIAGFAAFDWGDYSPLADGAKVEIRNSLGAVVATPFYMDGSIVCPIPCGPGVPPSGFNGPWTPWSFTAAADDTYTVVYAARNTLDSSGPEQTHGYFDASEDDTKVVPEPASVALLGLGLAGLGFMRRKQA